VLQAKDLLNLGFRVGVDKARENGRKADRKRGDIVSHFKIGPKGGGKSRYQKRSGIYTGGTRIPPGSGTLECSFKDTHSTTGQKLLEE